MSQHLRPIPFVEALRLAKERDVVLPDSYYGEIPRSLRSRSFSITGLASQQQIQGVLNDLNRSLDAGETFEEWQDRVDAGEVRLDLPQHRRELIFRNHVQSQYNRGRFEALQETKEDIPFVRYDAVNDSRTRPSHLAMDGHVAEQDAAIWDTWWPLNGHNCLIGGETVLGDVTGAVRRHYSGKACEITTRSGRTLRVTANHPILTGQGWVVAQRLNPGDELVGYDTQGTLGLGVTPTSRQASTAPGQVSHDEEVTRAEDAFNALARDALAIAPASTLQLYDDVADREVHVNVADGRLIVEGDAPGRHRVHELPFVGRDVAAAGGSSASGRAASGTVAVDDPVLAQDAADVAATDSEAASDVGLSDALRPVDGEHPLLQARVLGVTGSPSRAELPLDATRRLFDALPLQSLGLAGASENDALLSELSLHGWAGDAGLFGYLLEAYPALVFRDPVVDVREFHFSGHVYDLQTSEAIVAAGGLITHNCRCTVVGVTERQAEREGLGGGDTSKQPDPGWEYHPGKAPGEGARRAVDQASENAGAMAQNVSELQPPATMSLDDALSAGDDEVSDLQRRLNDELGEEAGDVATDATAMRQAIRTKLAQTGRRGEAPRNTKGNKTNQALLADATADLPDSWKRATDRSTRVRLRKQQRRAFHFRAPEQPNQSNGTFRARFRGLGNVDLNPGESLISFNSERSALHEYVHAVQHSAPDLDDYFQELFERRTQGDQLRQIQIGEFAKPDDFVTSYAGRVYDDPSGAKAYLGRAGALEVMTITYEYLLSPVTSRRQELIDKDPELAKLALALLFRYDP